jgi:spoIIIJ-associated protein
MAEEKVIEHTNKFIKEVLGYMNVSPDVEVVRDEENYIVKIVGEDLNFLIGYRGTSLNGLQHLLSLSAYKSFGEWYSYLVDINDYRKARKEKLEEMAKSLIDRVRFFSKEVPLPPMTAFERKQIHEFVSEYDDVESFSVGEGSDRHVVLKPV